MSKANLEQFRQKVAQDSALQEQLSQAKDNESLITIVFELGQQKGYSFSRQEIEEYINDEMNTFQEELSEEQLEAIAGGACGGPWKPCRPWKK